MSKIEIKLQFPYVVPTQHEHCTAGYAHYNTIVHKNKINVALNLMWLTVGCYEISNRPQGWVELKETYL